MIFSIATRASQNGLSLAILAVLVVPIRPTTLPSRARSGQRIRNQPREIDQLSADPKDPHPYDFWASLIGPLGDVPGAAGSPSRRGRGIARRAAALDHPALYPRSLPPAAVRDGKLDVAELDYWIDLVTDRPHLWARLIR
jgi:hypothetical protein